MCCYSLHEDRQAQVEALRQSHPVWKDFDFSLDLSDRYESRDVLKEKSFVKWFDPKPFEMYFYLMNSHLFIASPWGYSPDCYRTWEALYLGSVPIVRDHLTYRDFDLPIIKVKRWEDISPKFLEQSSKWIFSRTYNYDQLKISYWTARIDELRNQL